MCLSLTYIEITLLLFGIIISIKNFLSCIRVLFADNSFIVFIPNRLIYFYSERRVRRSE